MKNNFRMRRKKHTLKRKGISIILARETRSLIFNRINKTHGSNFSMGRRKHKVSLKRLNNSNTQREEE